MTAPIVIPLPWEKPPLNQNDRLHYRVKATLVASAKADAEEAIGAVGPESIVGAEVTLHYRPKDKRRCDADNLAVVLKVCQDALVTTRVLPRDDWVHVPAATCRIHPPTGEPAAMWLELTNITHYETGERS